MNFLAFIATCTAFLLWATTIWISNIHVSGKRQGGDEHKVSSAYQRSNEEKSVQNTSFSVPSMKQAQDERNEHHRRCERRYWLFSGIIGLVTMASAIGAAIAAGLAWGQARSANRAWLSPHLAHDMDLAVFKDSFPIALDVMITNVGHDPAVQVIPAYGANAYELSAMLPEHILWKAENICNAQIPGSKVITTIFPGNSDPGTVMHIPFEPNYIARDLPYILAGARLPVVNGCLTYNTLGETHHSRFCYFFQPSPAQNPQRWLPAECPAGNEAD